MSAGTRYTYTVSAGNAYQASAPGAALKTAASLALVGVIPDVGDIEGGAEISIDWPATIGGLAACATQYR